MIKLYFRTRLRANWNFDCLDLSFRTFFKIAIKTARLTDQIVLCENCFILPLNNQEINHCGTAVIKIVAVMVILIIMQIKPRDF